MSQRNWFCSWARVVGRRGLGRERGEPARGVAERGDQGQAGPALRGRLRRGHGRLAGGQVSRGVLDVDDLDIRGDQLLERERRVERGVPGGHAAGQHAAHGQRGIEQARVVLDQPGGDDAAQGVPPRDRGARLAEGLIEGAQGADLVRQRLLDGPAGGGVGRPRQGEAVTEQGITGERVADVGGRVLAAGRDVAVAVEQQCPVPGAGRALDQVGGPVVERTGQGGHRAGTAAGRSGSCHGRRSRREPADDQCGGECRPGQFPCPHHELHAPAERSPQDGT